jgi:hypothetical protein
MYDEYIKQNILKNFLPILSSSIFVFCFLSVNTTTESLIERKNKYNDYYCNNKFIVLTFDIKISKLNQNDRLLLT